MISSEMQSHTDTLALVPGVLSLTMMRDLHYGKSLPLNEVIENFCGCELKLCEEIPD